MIEYSSGKATIMPAPPSTERSDGILHLVALVIRLREWKQDPDAEIEAVEDHVHRDGETDDCSPDDQ